MPELTYEPVAEIESTRQRPVPRNPARGVARQRSECPFCGGTINRVAYGKVRWNKNLGDYRRLCAIYCNHCEVGSLAEFACDHKGNLTSNRCLHGTRATIRDVDALLREHPDLAEGLDLS
ncbi:MAG: hypothetical protein AAGF84_03895 [Planctomycetota bacterium]